MAIVKPKTYLLIIDEDFRNFDSENVQMEDFANDILDDLQGRGADILKVEYMFDPSQKPVVFVLYRDIEVYGTLRSTE